jgi:hypothetical protein
MDAMLEKNVSTLSKSKDGTTTSTKLIDYNQMINVSASLGRINLTTYGISESIIGKYDHIYRFYRILLFIVLPPYPNTPIPIATMDRAVQVSIAAGLEALKDARLVTGLGEGTSGWELPEHMQSTTGIVYATSFPALDTAIAEVSSYFSSKSVTGAQVRDIILELRKRLVDSAGDLSKESETALVQLEKVAGEATYTDQVWGIACMLVCLYACMSYVICHMPYSVQ